MTTELICEPSRHGVSHILAITPFVTWPAYDSILMVDNLAILSNATVNVGRGTYIF